MRPRAFNGKPTMLQTIESGLTPDELDRDGFNLAERTGLKPSESFETLANAPAEGSLGAPLSEDQLAEAAQALDGLSGLNEDQRQARLASWPLNTAALGSCKPCTAEEAKPSAGMAQRDANGNVVTQDGATVFNNSLVVDEQLSARMSDIDQLVAHLPDEREALQRQA